MNRVPNSLIDDLATDLKPVRPMQLMHGMALVSLTVVAMILVVELAFGLWRDMFGARTSALFFIANGMLGLLGAASALAVIRMAGPRVGSSHDGARWALAMFALLPIVALGTLGVQGTMSEITGDPYGMECFVSASALGLLTFGALTFWLRRGAPVSLGAAGLFTGIAAGATGSFALGLACPIDTLAHLGIWHVVPVVLCGIVGRFAVPPLVRW